MLINTHAVYFPTIYHILYMSHIFSRFGFEILVAPPCHPQNDFPYRQPCKTRFLYGKGPTYTVYDIPFQSVKSWNPVESFGQFRFTYDPVTHNDPPLWSSLWASKSRGPSSEFSFGSLISTKIHFTQESQFSLKNLIFRWLVRQLVKTQAKIILKQCSIIATS